jgi:hypothetical protein
MVLQRTGTKEKGEYYLGMDIAKGTGQDETTWEVFQKVNKKYYHRENIANNLIKITDTIRKTLDLDDLYHFKQAYIDTANLGIGVYDYLLTSSKMSNRVVSIENATRSISPDKSRTRKLLKEDLYINLLRMMENGEIFLLDDPDVFTSFKSIMLEHDKSNSNIRLWGRYSHIVEGCIRAAWANHSDRLSLWVR